MGHNLYLKADEQLQWGDERDVREKERKKKTLETHKSFNYDTINIIR